MTSGGEAWMTVPGVAYCPSCGAAVGVPVFGKPDKPRVIGYLTCSNAVHGAGGLTFRMPPSAVKKMVLDYLDKRLAPVKDGVEGVLG